MSPDPSRLSIQPSNPQTWNRYSYVYNNPLGLKDDNGKWPTAIHEQIIDKAFPNLSATQRQILKNISASQDNPFTGGQDPSRSIEHAMSSDGNATKAAADYNIFVANNENTAAALQGYKEDLSVSDLTPESLAAFAKALHAVLDSTSPAHEGFQQWKILDAIGHHFRETSISDDQMKKAVQAARATFYATYLRDGLNTDNTSVSTSYTDPQPCGGNTGRPCQ